MLPAVSVNVPPAIHLLPDGVLDRSNVPLATPKFLTVPATWMVNCVCPPEVLVGAAPTPLRRTGDGDAVGLGSLGGGPGLRKRKGGAHFSGVIAVNGCKVDRRAGQCRRGCGSGTRQRPREVVHTHQDATLEPFHQGRGRDVGRNQVSATQRLDGSHGNNGWYGSAFPLTLYNQVQASDRNTPVRTASPDIRASNPT